MITFLILAAAATVEAAPITKIEARSFPPAKVKRLVLEQLGDTLTEQRFGYSKQPKNILEDMTFATVAHATDVPGLCQIDRLTVNFRPLDEQRRDARTPVVAEGVEADHVYHFIRQPKDVYDEIADQQHSLNDEDCGRSNTPATDFFGADNSKNATDGYLATKQGLRWCSIG